MPARSAGLPYTLLKQFHRIRPPRKPDDVPHSLPRRLARRRQSPSLVRPADEPDPETPAARWSRRAGERQKGPQAARRDGQAAEEGPGYRLETVCPVAAGAL